jgi:hypothetical protein
MAAFLYSMPYFLVFSFLLIFFFPITNRNIGFSVYTSFTNIFAAFLLILFIGLRAYVYTDWVNYLPWFKATPSFFNGWDKVANFLFEGKYQNWEKGFNIYGILCKTFSSNYFFFQFISSFIDVVILYYFFKAYIPGRIVLGFIFFFLFSGLQIEINLLRNSKAIMLFLISIKYIEKRKISLYFLFNFIGCLFHISSVFYLPLYFILNKRIPKLVVLFAFLMGNILFLFSIKWLGVLLTLLSHSGSKLSFLIRLYLSSDLWSSSFGISIGFIERTISFFLFTFFFYDKLIKTKKENIIFINCFYMYIFFYLYCSEMLVLIQRMPILFIFSYWVLYPQIYDLLSSKRKKYFFAVLLFYSTLKLLSNYHSEEFRYQNIILKYDPPEKQREIIRRYEKNVLENLGQK